MPAYSVRSETVRRNGLIAGMDTECLFQQPAHSREYIVPILIKAIQIIELLKMETGGLRIEDIHRMTKIPKSTVYRIVRTLAAGNYLSLHVGRTYKVSTGLNG